MGSVECGPLTSTNEVCGRLSLVHRTVANASQSKEDMKQGNKDEMRKWSHTLSTCSKMSHPRWPPTDHGSCCHRLGASGGPSALRCAKIPPSAARGGGGNLRGIFLCFCLAEFPGKAHIGAATKRDCLSLRLQS